MYCKKCGKQNSENSDFCTNCGMPLIGPQNANVQNSVDQTSINNISNDNQFGVNQNNQIGVSTNTMVLNQTPMNNTGVSESLSGVGQNQGYNDQNNTQYQNVNQSYSNQKPNHAISAGSGATRKALKKDAKSKPKGALIGTYFAIMAIAIALIIFLVCVAVVPAIVATANGDSVNAADLLVGTGIFIVLFFVYIIVAYIVLFGMQMATIKIVRGETQTVGNILTQGFKNFGKWAKAFAGVFIFGLITSLLNLIPILGTIASFILTIYITPTLALYMLIHADEKQGNVSIADAFKKAMEMSKGHRVEFYGLILSFFGWFILGVVTFGIAYIWVMPYLMLSMANFYRRLTGEVTFEEAEKGMSNGAIIGVVIAGYFVFIIGIVALVSAFIMAAGVDGKIGNSVDNDYSDTNDEWDDSDIKANQTSSKLINMSGVNVYLPSDYIIDSTSEYDSAYMSPDGKTKIGVKNHATLPASMDLSTYATTYRDTVNNMNFICGDIDVDNINGNEWQSFECDYSGSDVYAYLAVKDGTIYLVAIQTSTDDDELVDNIEKNLSFAN